MGVLNRQSLSSILNIVVFYWACTVKKVTELKPLLLLSFFNKEGRGGEGIVRYQT